MNQAEYIIRLAVGMRVEDIDPSPRVRHLIFSRLLNLITKATLSNDVCGSHSIEGESVHGRGLGGDESLGGTVDS